MTNCQAPVFPQTFSGWGLDIDDEMLYIIDVIRNGYPTMTTEEWNALQIESDTINRQLEAGEGNEEELRARLAELGEIAWHAISMDYDM